jgi:hypothetical protein
MQREYKKISERPFWNGTPMPDKTLFVYYECALGDTLMYVRYLELLKGMFKKVLFKPQITFLDLFRENNFGTEIIDYKILPDAFDFDTHVSLMSLPYVLNHTEEIEIPSTSGYISANSKLVQKFKELYFDNDKLKIGVKWMGNIENDKTRIIDAESFYKLFSIPDIQFYSVQKDDGQDEFNKIPKEYKVTDLSEALNNFSDTAAAIENMDLVICNDTSVAHLAGSMGKPCWVVLPFVQNWRWHSDITYSPWYESVKLFKQIEPGNWDEVFSRIKFELENFDKDR